MSRAMRGKSEGSVNTLTKERFLKNAVGECLELYIQIAGIPLKCVLDTNVSTSFFRNHLKGSTAKWFKLTAANKLPLPYLGYVELDIDVMGLAIP